ncbi:MAG: porphobilinogen synthase, partial [Polyangiaceae bacterium]|nr:porphobilinogen synthase [Polyangiaceae bacterium]
MSGAFPRTRLRRLRRHDWSRRLVREVSLSVDDLVWPVFVREGEGESTEVASMPGVYRHSVDRLVEAVGEAASLGIPSVALFPVTPDDRKSDRGEEAVNEDNLICRAVRALKAAHPGVGIICDVALDPYTTHGQDGIVDNRYVVNDETVDVLCKQAVVQARAGCDVIAPSDMMDGRIGAIR